MKCEEIPDVMLDVIYGEDVAPARAFRFFSHLKGCATCETEYLELLEARALLAEMPAPESNFSLEFELPESPPGRRRLPVRRTWWPALQRVAAVVVILVGLAYLLQVAGLAPDRSQPITEGQLRALINDVVVARQDESMRIIGEALVTIKEDIELRNQVQMKAVYEDMNSLQRNLMELGTRNRNVSSTQGN